MIIIIIIIWQQLIPILKIFRLGKLQILLNHTKIFLL